MPKKAAIYPRLSLDKSGKGANVRIQIEEAEEWVAEQDDLELVGVYGGDNSLSASRYARKGRPDYDRLVTDIAVGKIDLIVMTELSRLSRDIGDIAALLDLGDRHRVTVATTSDERHNLWTAAGVHGFVAAINDSAYESAKLSERLKRKKRAGRREGLWAGGTRPFGFEVHGTILDVDGKKVLRNCKLTPHPIEAELVREAARRILAGGSLSGICRTWSTRGIRRPKGRPFQVSDLRTLLSSPRNAALVRQADGTFVAAQWAPILERGRWERLVAVMDASPRRRPGPATPSRYLLSAGILYCSACVARDPKARGMNGNRSRGIDSYRCRQCDTQITAAKVDVPIRDAGLWALATPEYRAALTRTAERDAPDSARAAELVGATKALDARLLRLRQRLGRGQIDDDDFDVAREEVDTDRALIDAELARLTDTSAALLADLPESFDDLKAEWAGWDLDRRRAVLKLAFNRVLLHRVGPGRRFDPERHLVPDWRV